MEVEHGSGDYLERWPDGQVKIRGHLVRNKRQGAWEMFYANGVRRQLAHYENGEKHGLLLRWTEDGRLGQRERYRHGEPHGPMESWHPNGVPRFSVYYQNGEQCGPWYTWDQNGELVRQKRWEPCSYQRLGPSSK